MDFRFIRNQPMLVRLIWATLVFAVAAALLERLWSLAFVAAVTLVLTLVPLVFQRRLGIRLPVQFLVGIMLFLFGTIFLGEAFDFYNRYWWWDVVLHGGSAVGFGLTGFLFVFMLFEGDRYAAPAWAVAFVSFCFALSIGTLWEIFEFAMDQIFGLTMQKSGLTDTMWDLIVDTLGASLGAFAGFLYLKGRDLGGLTSAIRTFVAENRRLFRKRRR
jgi:hypothetical protein